VLGSKTILIADGSTYAALDLSTSIEDNDGCVAGPVDTLPEALAILDSCEVGGAVVDCELADAAALVMRLIEQGVPLVVQTSMPLPNALERLDGRLSVLMRPVGARTIIRVLADEISKAAAMATKVNFAI
jgi:hypothetical protein